MHYIIPLKVFCLYIGWCYWNSSRLGIVLYHYQDVDIALQTGWYFTIKNASSHLNVRVWFWLNPFKLYCLISSKIKHRILQLCMKSFFFILLKYSFSMTNCSSFALFSMFDLFSLFAVRTIRYLVRTIRYLESKEMLIFLSFPRHDRVINKRLVWLEFILVWAHV